MRNIVQSKIAKFILALIALSLTLNTVTSFNLCGESLGQTLLGLSACSYFQKAQSFFSFSQGSFSTIFLILIILLVLIVILSVCLYLVRKNTECK
jgi:hypothetical protein